MKTENKTQKKMPRFSISFTWMETRENKEID